MFVDDAVVRDGGLSWSWKWIFKVFKSDAWKIVKPRLLKPNLTTVQDAFKQQITSKCTTMFDGLLFHSIISIKQTG